MQNKFEIYRTADNQTEINVQFDEETVWLTQKQMAALFGKDLRTINEHLKNIFASEELEKQSTIRKFRIVQSEGTRNVERQVDHYNLDAIISVGYRVNSKQGVKFRQWATQQLKDYLVKGYAINKKRLAQKQQEIEYLKTGIRIVTRAIEDATDDKNREIFQIFANGLALLDHYDHQTLDKKGKTNTETKYPEAEDYFEMIRSMYSEFQSEVFAKMKDDSFYSSINQIKQSFGSQELYPTLEEKAANLLYFITKNHSFVDGNKRIAAVCFLYFLDENRILFHNKKTIIDNETLAALTLFVANSKPEEADIVKHFIISILNQNIKFQ